jgi:hypothetical protein
LTDVTPQSDGLSAEERRGLTRQMLKARRENPEEPAEVRPTPTSRPADSGPSQDSVADAKAAGDGKGNKDSVADAKAAGDGKGNTATVKAAADRTPSDHSPADRAYATARLPVARPASTPARPDAAAPAATPPAAAAAQSAPPPLRTTTDAKLQPPMTVNPSSGAEPEPEPHGFAANVFSSLSAMAGAAANATGNTVNWVIDLPGKAISAGGRLFGRDSSTSNQPAGSPPSAGNSPSPATLPPPATAPPPRRNL